jgi:hypothetical protein
VRSGTHIAVNGLQTHVVVYCKVSWRSALVVSGISLTCCVTAACLLCFRNFAQGGEWVIQRALSNSNELSRMLPPGAPLSTLRVVTASTAWLDKSAVSKPAYGTAGWIQRQQQGASRRLSNGGQWLQKRSHSSSSGSGGSQGPGRVTPELPLSAGLVQQQDVGSDLQPLLSKTAADGSNSSSGRPAPAGCLGGSSSDSNDTAAGLSSSEQQLFDGRVQVVTAVWRAGLAGKDTDHSSICFPMDAQTGVLSQGVSANHWYKLGWRWCGRVDGSTAGRAWLHHPDSQVPVAGEAGYCKITGGYYLTSLQLVILDG